MNIESNPFNIIDILDNLYAQTGNDNYRLLSANIKAVLLLNMMIKKILKKMSKIMDF